MTEAEHREIVEALALVHREELSRVNALLVAYREALRDAGVEPPDMNGEMALERYRHVFFIAGHLDQMQHPELLADWWVRDRRRREEVLSVARPQ